MKVLLLLLLSALLALPVLAQQGRIITDDDVTRVAERMYCPVCENIPLDDCGMPTCLAWKQEIGEMMAAGMSDEAIMSIFVARYGERVLSVPQNAMLRLLAVAMPVIGLLLACVAAGLTFSNWEKRKQALVPAQATPAVGDVYRQQFERDV